MRAKRFFNFLVVAILSCSAATMLTACSEDDNPVNNEVTLEEALNDGTIVVLTFNVNGEDFYVAFVRVGDTYELLDYDKVLTRSDEPTITEKDCEYTMEHDKANNVIKFTVKEKKTSDLVLIAIFDVKESTMEVITGDPKYKVTGVKMKVSNVEITHLLKEKGEGAGDWTVSVSGTYTYTGSAIVPDAGNITVKTATDVDIAAGNYDVFVNNNTNAGEATLIVSGIGVYAGKVASCTYTIGKAAGSISYANADVHKAVGKVFTNALTKVGDGTATYSSSNPDVATVDSSTGEVTVVAVGTTTITATAADGANYVYASPTTTYTLMVTNLTTLTALKALVNEGTDCSTYLGYEVNSNGDIAEKNVSGTLIGYISYISTSDVDKDISGSRILVIASEDANSCDWGDSDYARGVYGSDMCGYSNTNNLIGPSTLRNGERQIKSAVAAWEYSAAIPASGATPAHWFLPSKAQFDAMISACGSIEQLWEKLHLVNTEYSIYWSSTFDHVIFCIQYSQYGYDTSWYEKSKNRVGRVRACFAY